MSALRLIHARIVTPGRVIPDGAVDIADGLVTAVSAASEVVSFAGKIVDLGGRTLLPGFVDIHCHGRNGADFSDGTREAFETIGRYKLEEGVTTVFPTTLTLPKEAITEVMCRTREYAPKFPAAKMPGVHLEGPFVAPSCAGAQNPGSLRLPDWGEVDSYRRIGRVMKLSLSPELPGALEVIRRAVAAGIVCSGAHSAATYEDFLAAREAGMTQLTHFCNVMTPLHHLRPGMVGGGLVDDSVSVEVIGDGVHIRDVMLRVILKMKGAERTMLVTDAMRAAGLPDGESSLGGLKVFVGNGRATLADGTVAGSVGTMIGNLRNLRRLGEVPDEELIKVAGFNQARAFGLAPGTGEIVIGGPADLVVADGEWKIERVFVNGVGGF